MSHHKRKTNDANTLEIVVKCDNSGCLEVVLHALENLDTSPLKLSVISRGLGAVNKNDIINGQTGSRLIVGFNVGVLPYIDQMSREKNVEIRLYSVIYRLTEDIQNIAASLVTAERPESITGKATVIALFKSCRRGIILGCEVRSGEIEVGNRFRILSPMGQVYNGTVESLHIEKYAVRKAVKGKKVGIKIRNFNKAKTGYHVECYHTESPRQKPWQPCGKIIHCD